MLTTKSVISLLGLLWVLLYATPAIAEVEISGFAQTNYGARVTGAGNASGRASDFLLGEERLQLKFEGFSRDGSSSFVGKVDLFQDAVWDQSGLEVRELYLDLESRYITLRAGRQIVTWGTGDLLFLNGIFPKDWVSFFTGRPMQYLKVGSDAVKIGLHPGFLTGEIVVAPLFQPDRYPTGERLVFDDPFPPTMTRHVETKERSFGNTEISARVSRYVSDWEIALYASRSFYRLPAVRLDGSPAPTSVRYVFPRLNTYGGSLTGGLYGGVLNVEGAYYDSEEDRNGDDDGVENSQIRGLVGYNHALWEDAALGAQGYVESMRDHDAHLANRQPGFPALDEFRWVSTLRFTQMLLQQTLTFGVFAFGGVTEQDAYLIPSLRYSFTDALWGEIGANIFVAKDMHTFFGRFDDNDNVYLTARYGF
jgi:hypothetical protein